MVSLNSLSLPQPAGFQPTPVLPRFLLTAFLISAVSTDVVNPLSPPGNRSGAGGRLLLLSPHLQGSSRVGSCWESLGIPVGWSRIGLPQCLLSLTALGHKSLSEHGNQRARF